MNTVNFIERRKWPQDNMRLLASVKGKTIRTLVRFIHPKSMGSKDPNKELFWRRKGILLIEFADDTALAVVPRISSEHSITVFETSKEEVNTYLSESNSMKVFVEGELGDANLSSFCNCTINSIEIIKGTPLAPGYKGFPNNIGIKIGFTNVSKKLVLGCHLSIRSGSSRIVCVTEGEVLSDFVQEYIDVS